MAVVVASFGPVRWGPCSCALCLAKIHQRVDAPLWQRTFRVIWRITDEYQLSGVGLGSAKGRFDCVRVPRDQRKRWDTVDDDDITLSVAWSCKDDIVFLHELCWERLQDHFNPSEIQLRRLFWVLSSFLRRGTDSIRDIPGPVRDLPTDPPFYQPSLEQLLQRGVRIPDRTPEVVTQFAHGRNATDPFTVLALEIKEIIAEQLNTRDILTLRTVSRAMEGVFFSSRFWRTRFEVNGERGFLYRAVRESSRGTGDSIDWQHLYHSTSMLPWNDQFDRMLRIWETFRWIRDTCLNQNSTPPLDFQGRALQHYHNTRYEGTKVETVDIPPKLATIGVSILADDEDIVITGLEFYSEDGSSKSLGYKTPGAKTRTETEMASRIQHRHLSGYSSMSGKMDPHSLQDFYRPPGFHVLMDARSLRGFGITRAPNGIFDLCLRRQGQPIHSRDHHRTLQMAKLISVVATSDICARRILDLGIRGHYR